MRRALALFSLALVAAVVPFSHALPSQPLGHVGQWLTDSDGRVVELHGFNMVAKLPPYTPQSVGFGGDDAQFLADHGFNVVRLGVILAGLEPQPGTFDDAYLSSIASTVQTLADHNIYSLLDFHQDLYNERFQGEGMPTWMVQDDGLPAQPQAGFPGNYFVQPALNRTFDHFWANDPGPRGIGLQDEYAQAWAHVASYFAGNVGVLGYDVFNEPWPGTQYPTCVQPGGCPVFDGQFLGPFMKKVVDAIHAVDPAHIAFYEPNVTMDYGVPTYVGKPGDNNAGLSFHIYCLAALGVPSVVGARNICDFEEGRVVSNAQTQSASTGDALLLSEFGATTDTAELRSVTDLADQNSVPWTEWAYCGCSDPTGNPSGEGVVNNPAQSPTGSNVNQTTLASLDEPYPTATTGVPSGYHFDPATEMFSYTYSTSRAGGGAFASGLTTDIYVPTLQYPAGYVVQVTGAQVVSAANAGTLQLANDAGATTVSVQISPAA